MKKPILEQFQQNIERIREQENSILLQAAHFLKAIERSSEGISQIIETKCENNPSLASWIKANDFQAKLKDCLASCEPLRTHLNQKNLQEEHLFLDQKGVLTPFAKEMVTHAKETMSHIPEKKEIFLKTLQDNPEAAALSPMIAEVIDKNLIKELRVLMNYTSAAAAVYTQDNQDRLNHPTEQQKIKIQTGAVIPEIGNNIYSSNAHLIQLNPKDDQIAGLHIRCAQHPRAQQSEPFLKGLWLKLSFQDQPKFTKAIQATDIQDAFLAAVAKDPQFGENKLYFQLIHPKLQQPNLGAPLLVQGIGGMVCALLEWRMQKQLDEMIKKIYLGAQGAFGPRFNHENFVLLDEKGKKLPKQITHPLLQATEQQFNKQYIQNNEPLEHQKSYFESLTQALLKPFKNIFYGGKKEENIKEEKFSPKKA